jgi:hypothetical protein
MPARIRTGQCSCGSYQTALYDVRYYPDPRTYHEWLCDGCARISRNQGDSVDAIVSSPAPSSVDTGLRLESPDACGSVLGGVGNLSHEARP